MSSFKLWLKYAKPTHGALVGRRRRRAGAARARHQPAAGRDRRGRRRVRGRRRGRGATAGGGRPIGKGIVNYSAAELRRIKGMKSEAVREVIPRARRGGRPPRLLRARLSRARSTGPLPLSHGHRRTNPSLRSASRARVASRALATASDDTKDAALRGDGERARCSGSTRSSTANERDMAAGAENGLSAALLDRLKLDDGARSRDRRRRARDRRAARPGRRGARGLPARRTGWRCASVRVPLGVVAVVYEARPNVTIDCSALCLKSGNAIVLRGSSIADALERGAGRDRARARSSRPACRATSSRWSPAAAARSCAELATQAGVVDLIIPRGGEGLKTALQGGRDGAGDLRRRRQLPRLRRRDRRPRRRAADRRSTPRSSGPASATRPRRCSSTPTPRRSSCRACSASCARPASSCASTRATRALAGDLADSLADADEDDWATEYLALILAVKVVDSLDEAIDHVNALRLGPLRGDRHRLDEARRALHRTPSTPPASTSTRRRASPTAACSGWAPRSATRPRSCTRAGRSACAS